MLASMIHLKQLIHLIVGMNLITKGNFMTEQEFKQALDKVVLEGINQHGAGVVLGALAVVSRFTEVVYDMSTVARLQQNSEAQAAPSSEQKVAE
jgi:hypothetical protein